eukprot:3691136-Amphidinium_carterae.1
MVPNKQSRAKRSHACNSHSATDKAKRSQVCHIGVLAQEWAAIRTSKAQPWQPVLASPSRDLLSMKSRGDINQ